MDYSNKITLIKNSRGVYDLDTSKGCFSGMVNNYNGCYNECYAARQARQYGYNFNKTILREFENVKHVDKIRTEIYNIDMPFIRIGVTGDPSENWAHTLSIINLISGIKPIVLITKHWNKLTLNQLKQLYKFNLIINTSISALDNNILIKHRLEQYNRLKYYCNSVLRIVSCKFNLNNLTGLYLNDIQYKLFNNDNIIDNVLRVSLNNKLVKQNIIKIKSEKFLTKNKYFSKNNKNTFTGHCLYCPDMCGLYL